MDIEAIVSRAARAYASKEGDELPTEEGLRAVLEALNYPAMVEALRESADLMDNAADQVADTPFACAQLKSAAKRNRAALGRRPRP